MKDGFQHRDLPASICRAVTRALGIDRHDQDECVRSDQPPSNTAVLSAFASRLIPTKYDSFDSWDSHQHTLDE